MDVIEVIDELRRLGSESIKKTLMRHGAHEPVFGVTIGDMKPLQKRLRINHELALELYDSGISNAMYLAGLIADDPRMTRDDLQRWAGTAYWSQLFDYTVPWVAAGGHHGWPMALEWIESDSESVAACGWSTLGSILTVTDDSKLDIAMLSLLLRRLSDEIHRERNRVRSSMNGFLIAAGTYVAPLTGIALTFADAIGPVHVDVGDTSCKVSCARTSIEKAAARGAIGKKRKSAKC